MVVREFHEATVRHNTLVAAATVVSLEGADRLLDGLRWDAIDYHVTDGRGGDCSVVESAERRRLSFPERRVTAGLDPKSTSTNGNPSKRKVIVRPNAHDAERAHVAVLIPSKLPEVDVDLSGVLTSGQPFQIVSVKDFFGTPLVPRSTTVVPCESP